MLHGSRFRSFVLLFISFATASTTMLSSCKKDDYEQEVTTKRLNFAKHTKYSDREWSELFEGKRTYERFCSGCHGLKGDGKGPAAQMLQVQPRNFTHGMFKFISTAPGSLPSDNDLHRTLMRGVPRSSMPNWSMLTEPERVSIIKYLKTFSERWESRIDDDAPPLAPVSFTEPPTWVGGEASVRAGLGVYKRMGCFNCHGETGKADGMSSDNLTDAEGNKIVPFNFRDGVLKGGSTVKDIYRTFYTGLAGTPMPAYGGILNEKENWHLVSYVLYLMGKTRVHESAIQSSSPIDTTVFGK